ncbi:MAG: FMN-binding protein [Prolixibacteraceae bacterium]|nr:FMN-binding protein [Prolixibacteraceae bacterium]
MQSFKFIFIFVLNILSNLSFSQEEIDYTPKTLTKILKSEGEHVKIDELPLADSMFAEIQNGKYFEIHNNSEPTAKFIYIGRVNSCRAGGCSIDESSVLGGFEYFDYFILFDRELTVQQIKVFNYQATKGQEITAKNWLKQFIGYKSGSDLQVGKQIDGISGATVSAHSLTADVVSKTKILEKICSKLY